MSKTNGGAVIYCRVETLDQARRRRGLDLQRDRCMSIAASEGLNVLETFSDIAHPLQVERPGMNAMLAFLRRHRRAGVVVLAMDGARLSEDYDTQIQLLAAIHFSGGKFVAPHCLLELKSLAELEAELRAEEERELEE